MYVIKSKHVTGSPLRLFLKRLKFGRTGFTFAAENAATFRSLEEAGAYLAALPGLHLCEIADAPVKALQASTRKPPRKNLPKGVDSPAIAVHPLAIG